MQVAVQEWTVLSMLWHAKGSKLLGYSISTLKRKTEISNEAAVCIYEN